MSLICATTSVSPLPHTALCSVHPVAISTQSMVKANMPAMDVPQWATVSASRNPGRDSSHWFVFIGICFLRRVPGFVVDLPRPLYFTLTGFKSLSMLEGEIPCRALVTSAVRRPYCCSYPGSQSGSTALSLLEQGRFAASHICFRGAIISSVWYMDDLSFFFCFGLLNRLNLFISRMACLRWYLQAAQNSSSISFFCFLVPALYL